MPFWRASSAQPRNTPLHVTITTSIEVTPEQLPSAYHHLGSQVTSAVIGRPTYRISAPLLGDQLLLTMPQSHATSPPPQNGSTAFTRDTLGYRAYDELFTLSNHMVSQSEVSQSEAPSDMPEAEVLCPIEDEITNLATFSQHLSAKTALKDHAEAIATGESNYYLSNLAWTQDLLPLSNVDPPLFHLLCDSLYSHTPKDILGRWFGIRNYLLALGLSLSDLLHKAEMTPRRDWAPLVWVLYFLLLE